LTPASIFRKIASYFAVISIANCTTDDAAAIADALPSRHNGRRNLPQGHGVESRQVPWLTQQMLVR
jgi:hypothetical protein